MHVNQPPPDPFSAKSENLSGGMGTRGNKEVHMNAIPNNYSLHTADVATECGVQSATVCGWIRCGLLRATRINGRYRVSRDDLEVFLNTQRLPAPGLSVLKNESGAKVQALTAVTDDINPLEDVEIINDREHERDYPDAGDIPDRDFHEESDFTDAPSITPIAEIPEPLQDNGDSGDATTVQNDPAFSVLKELLGD
jgi:hypothetical protein